MAQNFSSSSEEVQRRFGRPRQVEEVTPKPASVIARPKAAATKRRTQTVKAIPASPKPAKPVAAPPADVSPPQSSAVENAPVDDSPALRATIQHSESLPPLPAKYQTGAFLGAYGLPPLTGRPEPPITVQFKVPEWLAGTWRRNSSTETKRTELPSGKALKPAGTTAAVTSDIFGTYRDKEGQIWQLFSSQHATGEVDRGDLVDHHRVTKYNLEIVGAKSAVVEVRAYHLVLSKKKHRIVQSYQDEELNTYSLVADGKLRTDSSVKVFDGNGSAKLLTNSTSEVVRVKRFEDQAARR
ncbi:MAG: hypothetical protein K2X93_04010 [Candidatus Obscuribacterales bacterium]|nr:hypothetical protein [Candidatus Obscuribacterales bacterium]